MGQPLQATCEGHQCVEKRDVQRPQLQYTVQLALEHHHRYAFNPVHAGRQLVDDVAHDSLDARVDFRVQEYVGALHQKTGHGECSSTVEPTRVMVVFAASHEQPTKSSCRLLMTWNTRP